MLQQAKCSTDLISCQAFKFKVFRITLLLPVQSSTVSVSVVTTVTLLCIRILQNWVIIIIYSRWHGELKTREVIQRSIVLKRHTFSSLPTNSIHFGRHSDNHDPKLKQFEFRENNVIVSTIWLYINQRTKPQTTFSLLFYNVHFNARHLPSSAHHSNPCKRWRHQQPYARYLKYRRTRAHRFTHLADKNNNLLTHAQWTTAAHLS